MTVKRWLALGWVLTRMDLDKKFKCVNVGIIKGHIHDYTIKSHVFYDVFGEHIFIFLTSETAVI